MLTLEQIPPICYPGADKKSYSSNFDLNAPAGPRVVALQNLANLLPDLSNNILHLYNRASNISGEPVPQLVYSETVIRLSKLLVAVRTRDGSLDDNALKSIVVNESLVPLYKPERPRGTVNLRKSDIVDFLFRGLPQPLSTNVPATDLVPIVVGVASVLSALDLPRKRAFILRGLLSTVVPTLVQARKIGAAEVGIHPAAGLASLSDTVFDINALDIGPGNMEESLRYVLAAIAEIYGAQGTEFYSRGKGTRDSYDSVAAIIERASRQSVLEGYGDPHLKVNVLKTCINCCEALPDFEGVLLFTAELLQTVRGDLMLVGPHRTPPFLPRDEQVRLLNNIKRTVGASQRLGISGLSAEYWDDFLVRGVQLLPLADSKRPVRQTNMASAANMANAENSRKDPFLYNPFSRPGNKATELVIVAGEQASFQVTLQNPFEFDLEIESLRLHSDGVSVDAVATDILLSPLSLQDVTVSGVATEDGMLNITACVAKVRCCHERKFPIFVIPWKPEREGKYKRTGLSAKEPASDRHQSWSSSGSGDGKVFSKKGPETSHCEVKVIKRQPSLVIERMSLSQSATMVLEGETRPFEITLHNVSACPVDFIHFTFHDSTTRQLQAALNSRDLLPTEVYELQLKLATKPALKWRRDDSSADDLSIPAGKCATYIVDVFGKPGLQDATVQIDYSSIGSPNAEIPDTFYTRQLFLPLTVTVNASIEVARSDIVPFSGDFAWWKNLGVGEELDSNEKVEEMRPPAAERRRFPSILSHLRNKPFGPDHCILLLDLRNSWPSPISVVLGVAGQSIATSEQISPEDADDRYTVDGELQPGQLSRFVLVLPRIHLDNPHAAIPALNTSFRRQFVVSTNRQSFEAEAASREAFWYREELLKRVYGTWKEIPIGRKGTVDLRSIRMNPRMVDAIQLEDVDISYSLTPLGAPETESDSDSTSQDNVVVQSGRSKYVVKTDELLRLVVTVYNRSSTSIHPLLRLQPSIRNQPSNIALDLPRRLAWTGMLQKVLPILHHGQSTQATLGVTILCRGEYEFGASVEEVRLLESPTAGRHGPQTQAGASSTADGGILDTFGAGMAKKRRIWHARESCIMNAHE